MLNVVIYILNLFFMELVFHLRFFGLMPVNLLFAIGHISLIGSGEALGTGFFPQEKQKYVFRVIVWLQFFIFAVQTVYLSIFNQPLQIEAVFLGGQNALTNFWRETLEGVVKALPILLLMISPVILLEVLRKNGKWELKPFPVIRRLRTGLVAWTAFLFCICTILIGDMLRKDFAENYLEYFDPLTVLQNMGVSAMVQRDSAYAVSNLVSGALRQNEANMAQSNAIAQDSTSMEGYDQISEREAGENGETEKAPKTDGTENGEVSGNSLYDENMEISEKAEENEVIEETEPEPDTSPNEWQLDTELLSRLSAGSKEKEWLADYITSLTGTNRNEYTGFFEGYNLIFLTAEGFSTYAISEELTPTLYKMAHSSFVFTNYYVPLWQTSTSDGEYVNCTGLIPDGQFSMRKSSANNMAYTLAKFFGNEGVYCRAYHNGQLDYYSRHLSHPNLGYDFKACKLGNLSEAEWGDWIFPMDEPNIWPASDLDMIEHTISDYIDEERFHTYYMTVSGHMNYNFLGNQMAKRNREYVDDLDLSENAKAYLACNKELDKAMEYLLAQLEEAGKLDNTVIVLSADHYPYGMDQSQYEELAGKDLSADMDMYRNTLLIWNAGIEEPVIVDKACCSVDILPTVLNLFGFPYDSRMYAGRDIFSEEEGLVIFNDQSFVSDTVIVNKKKKTTTWLKELTEAEQETYMEEKRQDVKDRYLFSAYILRNDYYDIISQCVIP